MRRGTVYVLRRRCGKPSCHCVEGKLHESEVYSVSIGKRRILRSVHGSRRDRLVALTSRYRRFRRARKRVREIFKRYLEIVAMFPTFRTFPSMDFRIFGVPFASIGVVLSCVDRLGNSQ